MVPLVDGNGVRIGRTEFAFSLRDVEQLPFVQHATLRRIEEVVGGGGL